ncbi:MAG: hypothetical protein ACI4HQ_14535 [Acetatifactor sp.]
MRKKIENAALWAATVMTGMVVINLQNKSAIDWKWDIIVGLAVGLLSFLWATVKEAFQKLKNKKK